VNNHCGVVNGDSGRYPKIVHDPPESSFTVDRNTHYRFNRRFDLAAMLPKLLRALATTSPLPLKALRFSEVYS
jgi:hypothetical protein